MEASAPIIHGCPTTTFTSDASMTGWGATGNGYSTGGFFSEQERLLHINVLEAKAVLFGLRSLGKDLSGTHIKILSDNTATVGAINNMGSSKSWDLNDTVFSIWDWTLEQDNWITASHIAGVLNTEADLESRRTADHTEWMLDRDTFDRVIKALGFQPEIDLFATRINNQLPRFVSFRPDPEAETIDAFTISWDKLDFYAFPPFICIVRILQKIQIEGGKGILIVPDWPNQPWYNRYQEMLIDELILYPREFQLSLPQEGEKRHPLIRTLRLRAGLVTATDL